MTDTALTDASGTSDPARYYVENCACICGCQFFCRPIDKGLCDFCRTGHHPTKAHFFDPEEEYECTFCGIPEPLASAPDNCPRITIAAVQLLST